MLGHDFMRGDLIRFIPRMIYHQDEPIGDPVCMPIYYLSEMARAAGVKVCQVGEGADEMFCGYPLWNIALRIQNLDQIPGIGWLKRAGMMARLKFLSLGI
jgi:asparagine synthase (glutamine-hydrolysing)